MDDGLLLGRTGLLLSVNYSALLQRGFGALLLLPLPVSSLRDWLSAMRAVFGLRAHWPFASWTIDGLDWIRIVSVQLVLPLSAPRRVVWPSTGLLLAG